MSWALAMEYCEVALVAQDWDGQHLDLRSAADLVDGVGAGAFSGPVRGAVAAFRDHWARHLTAVALGAERRADGLRSAVARFQASDEQSGAELVLLAATLGGQR